jgi:glycosyltransferase involved in cell wall biosynthesis
MKKILIVIPSIKIGGGAEKSSSLIGHKLLEKGYDVYLLTFYSYESEYKFPEKHRLELREKLGNFKLFKILKRSRKIAQICKEKDINIVISFMEPANFPAILSKLFGNIAKIIISIRTNPSIFPKTFKLLSRILYPKADCIVVLTEKIKTILREIIKTNSRIAVIHNALDMERKFNLEKEIMPEQFKSIFDNSFTFINVGNLKRPKGHIFLIRAFKAVNQIHKTAKLAIIGEGDYRKKIENLIKNLDLEGKVFLLGTQSNTYPFLKSSQCFVFSSLWEGFANVLLEAMSINIPIISADCIAGPREILNKYTSLEEKLTYPFLGDYGILTEPFPIELREEPNYKQPLIQGEKMLAELMLRMIGEVSLRQRYSHSKIRTKDFNVDNYVYHWIRLINSVE